MDANKKVIRDFFKKFGNQIIEGKNKTVDDEIFDVLNEACEHLLLDAVIRNRYIGDTKNTAPHQFTGNLINSIVVIMFSRATGEKYEYYAYDRLKDPIQREMSAITTRGTKRKNAYHFRPDWQNTPESQYDPELATDRSTGPQDARAFASTWQPSLKTPFEICVAYTSEYADFVQMQRKTVGILNSEDYTIKMMRGKGFKHVPVSYAMRSL